MPCCGGNRAAIRAEYEPAAEITKREGFTRFEYSGPEAIVVVGPATGARYRFERRGSRVAVHRSDAASLAMVRGLKEVR